MPRPLESGGEHRAAHADDAGLADTLEDGFGVLELGFRKRFHELRRVEPVIFDNNGHNHIAERMGSRFHGHNRAGHGSVNRRGDRCGVFADLLVHVHMVALFHQGGAGGTDVLCHGDDDLLRRCDHGHGNLGMLPVIGMDTALKFKCHTLHLVTFYVVRSLPTYIIIRT